MLVVDVDHLTTMEELQLRELSAGQGGHDVGSWVGEAKRQIAIELDALQTANTHKTLKVLMNGVVGVVWVLEVLEIVVDIQAEESQLAVPRRQSGDEGPIDRLQPLSRLHLDLNRLDGFEGIAANESAQLGHHRGLDDAVVSGEVKLQRLLALIEDLDCLRGELLVHEQDGWCGENRVREALLLVWPVSNCAHDRARDVLPSQCLAVDDIAHIVRQVDESLGLALHAHLELQSMTRIETQQLNLLDATNAAECVQRSTELVAETTNMRCSPALPHMLTQSSVSAEIDRDLL